MRKRPWVVKSFQDGVKDTSFGKTSASSKKRRPYDEATRKGKVVKRRHREAKVEIQYGSVTVELK
jgi:hypothetical protein